MKMRPGIVSAISITTLVGSTTVAAFTTANVAAAIGRARCPFGRRIRWGEAFRRADHFDLRQV